MPTYNILALDAKGCANWVLQKLEYESPEECADRQKGSIKKGNYFLVIGQLVLESGGRDYHSVAGTPQQTLFYRDMEGNVHAIGPGPVLASAKDNKDPNGVDTDHLSELLAENRIVDLGEVA